MHHFAESTAHLLVRSAGNMLSVPERPHRPSPSSTRAPNNAVRSARTRESTRWRRRAEDRLGELRPRRQRAGCGPRQGGSRGPLGSGHAYRAQHGLGSSPSTAQTRAARYPMFPADPSQEAAPEDRRKDGVMAEPEEQLTLADSSIHDVEGVPQRLVEQGTSDVVKTTDGLIIQIDDGDRDDVVATDDTRFGKAVLGTKFYFRSDAANRSRDGSARDRCEHFDCCVACEHADRTAASGRSEVCPVDVVAGYHAGAVFAASRRADSTRAGSAGCRRYANFSARSAVARSSASRTAWAPRRISSERLVPRSAASASRRSTRSSSSWTSTSRRAITICYAI